MSEFHYFMKNGRIFLQKPPLVAFIKL